MLRFFKHPDFIMIKRQTVLFAFLIAIIWTAIRLLTGHVPATTNLFNWQLPLTVSRWYDLLLAPIAALALYASTKIEQRHDSSNQMKDTLVIYLICLAIYIVATAMVLFILMPSMIAAPNFWLNLPPATQVCLMSLITMFGAGFIIGLLNSDHDDDLSGFTEDLTGLLSMMPVIWIGYSLAFGVVYFLPVAIGWSLVLLSGGLIGYTLRWSLRQLPVIIRWLSNEPTTSPASN
ncbi:MAG: hypothetical protein NTV81_04110 [Candidatus Komeilibacteria bacterium]|nr:hypothetical protein [Candidatus Komeilibacteria bacterium]